MSQCKGKSKGCLCQVKYTSVLIHLSSINTNIHLYIFVLSRLETMTRLFKVLCCCCCCCCCFQDRVFLCSPGCPGPHSVEEAGLELRDSSASASQVLGLKVCATTVQLLVCPIDNVLCLTEALQFYGISFVNS